ALAERGFTILNESDPIRLRYHFTRSNLPLILVTDGPFNRLPYHIWQQGHHVTLALHTFFPNLAYPQIQNLTPSQRSRLASAPHPTRRLGVKRTQEYVLQHVLGLDLNNVSKVSVFLTWISEMSRQKEAIPAHLRDMLLEELFSIPAYSDWPLDELLQKPQAFSKFISTQWSIFLEQKTGQVVREPEANYLVDFEHNSEVQDLFPGWIRSGLLTPLEILDPRVLPDWAQVGLITSDVDPRYQRFDDLLTILESSLVTDLTTVRWTDWKALAWNWAELCTLHNAADLALSEEYKQAYKRIQKQIDRVFYHWLTNYYAPLASNRLPQPHHMHHIPHYLAYKRRQDQFNKIALLVMDGMSLVDWTIIQSIWLDRHVDWLIQTELLLAQIPSLTAISRQALISGLCPVDFSSTITHNREEPKQWANFWASEDLSANACQYERLKLRHYPTAVALTNPHTQVICLIDNTIDNITHGTLLGATDVLHSIKLWLDEHAPQLESLVDELLQDGFRIFLTSDHGHTEAYGIGQPSEGVIVQTRSKRARTYNDKRLMNHIRSSFPETHVWQGDGLLPDDLWVLIPQEHRAFAPMDEIYVTHGGVSVDEMVVPFVEISLVDS
ncbi:MAG: BREX-3 system phosphatase PglZ, partial [Anaerolineales bacterium]